MPLFGSRSPLEAFYGMGGGRRGTPTGKPLPTTPEELSRASRPQRRGLFGSMFSGDMGRDPNFGDFLVGGMNRVDQIRMRPMEIQAAKEQMEAQRSEREQRTAQQSARREAQSAGEAYIMTLPPAQQVQARMQMLLDPEGFVASMRGGEWQGGPGYTHAWRTRPDGSTELGGELPLRPYAPRSSSSTQSYAGLPPGFDLD